MSEDTDEEEAVDGGDERKLERGVSFIIGLTFGI